MLQQGHIGFAWHLAGWNAAGACVSKRDGEAAAAGPAVVLCSCAVLGVLPALPAVVCVVNQAAALQQTTFIASLWYVAAAWAGITAPAAAWAGMVGHIGLAQNPGVRYGADESGSSAQLCPAGLAIAAVTNSIACSSNHIM